MCGIAGYIGNENAVPILIKGLKRLEYRGYDSAGIAVVTTSGELAVRKTKGKIAELEKLLRENPLPESTIGIAHTRWATHGAPTKENAHPHTDCTGTIALTHNGTIDNYALLYNLLESKKYKQYQNHRVPYRASDTDTEALLHLIETFYYHSGMRFETAVVTALTNAEGAFGIALVSSIEPHTLIAARRGSPLAIGEKKDTKEFFIASDPAAFREYTHRVTYLKDNEIAFIHNGTCRIQTIATEASKEVKRITETITFNLKEIEKGRYPHFMLKEIMEQPRTVENALKGRIKDKTELVHLGGISGKILERILFNLEFLSGRIIFTACGTSWHAALFGKYLVTEFLRFPTEVEYASEFRYSNPVLSKKDIVFVISQSGETADTLAALREAKRLGALTLGICNAAGSSIARESDGGVFLRAGPEIGVASTKAFTSELVALVLVTFFLEQKKGCDGITKERHKEIVRELKLLPKKIHTALKTRAQIQKIAKEFSASRNFLFLGRGYNFPVALEGALKLKEISYIHAEGYPAAEMKHGPIALIDENMPVVFIAPMDKTYERIKSNMEEVKARSGKIIAVATEGDKEIKKLANHVIYVPETLEFLSPILNVIPLQLLAYEIALLRGCDIDQPRNLAKSVTVE